MFDLLSPIYKPVVKVLLGALTLAVGISTFGNALVFDRVFYGVLIVTLFICRRNTDIVAVVCIVLAQRTLEELVWPIQTYTDIPSIKVIAYLALGVGYYKLLHDPDNKVIAPVILGLSIAAEIYWFITGYDAPLIVWSLFLIFLHMLTLYALMMRYFIMRRYQIGDPNIVCHAGFKVGDCYQWGIYLLILYVLEYLVRHLTGFNSLFIYTLFPYAQHTLNCYLIYVFLTENTMAIYDKKVIA